MRTGERLQQLRSWCCVGLTQFSHRHPTWFPEPPRVIPKSTQPGVSPEHCWAWPQNETKINKTRLLAFLFLNDQIHKGPKLYHLAKVSGK